MGVRIEGEAKRKRPRLFRTAGEIFHTAEDFRSLGGNKSLKVAGKIL